MKNTEIKKYIENIELNLKQADASFRIYCYLLKCKSKSRIKLYNNTPYIFHHLTNITLNDFINIIYKITEEKGQISFKKLRKELYKKGTRSQKKNIDKIRKQINKIRYKIGQIRCKITAHSDIEALNPETLLKKVKRDEIKFTLDTLLSLLNIYRKIYNPKNYNIYFDDKIDEEVLTIYLLLKYELEENKKDKALRRLKLNSTSKGLSDLLDK